MQRAQKRHRDDVRPWFNIPSAARQLAQLAERCRTPARSKDDQIHCAVAAWHDWWERPDNSFAHALMTSVDQQRRRKRLVGLRETHKSTNGRTGRDRKEGSGGRVRDRGGRQTTSSARRPRRANVRKSWRLDRCGRRVVLDKTVPQHHLTCAVSADHAWNPMIAS
jgi:hypothetical protein